MSTFLQLCQDVRREAGISGTGPSAVTGQTGELARVVEWVNLAWVEVQNSQKFWRWMRATVSVATSNGDNSYTPSDFSITAFGCWVPDTFTIYTTSVGQSDEVYLVYVPYSDWRYLYDFGSLASTSGKPTHYAIAPDNSVKVWPKPGSTGYTIRADYQKGATEMSADGDEPGMPSRFHPAIMWKALEYYGTYESAPEVVMRAKEGYRRTMSALRMDQLPEFMFAGPLA